MGADRSQWELKVVRIGLILAVVAATALLVFFCYRKLTPHYRVLPKPQIS
jgi:uncharacterized membrane protein (UPF0136 family)